MKTNIVLTLIICMSPLTTSAQLKVHSNGNTSIKNDSLEAFSPLSLNGRGDADYFIYYSGSQNGMYVLSENNQEMRSCTRAGFFINSGGNSNVNVGLSAFAYPGNSSGAGVHAIGMQGVAKNNGIGYSAGIMGMLRGNGNGAGIYGTRYNLATPDDRYAGFFYGKTKVQGDLIVTGSIQGILLGSAVNSPSNADKGLEITEEKHVSEKLSQLTALSFYSPVKENTEQYLDDKASDALLSANDSVESEIDGIEKDIFERQIQAKKHFAFSASQLEEAFPELVYEDENGAKSVNYMEMIPILVQSINELNMEIKKLKNSRNAMTRGEMNDEGNEMSLSYLTDENLLYQNAPNPFREKTTIRFRLADDAHDAAICIFDMTGKLLRKLPVTTGMESVTVNGWELGEGMFLYSLIVDGHEIDTKRMVLSK
jgi:hypothetical protein